MTDKIIPCPLCGSDEIVIDPQTYWTGRSSQVISVTLRHWCKDFSKDNFDKKSITIRARSEEAAIALWNQRPKIVGLTNGGITLMIKDDISEN